VPRLVLGRLTISYSDLGILLVSSGRPVEGRTFAAQALEMVQGLASKFPRVPEIQSTLGRLLSNAAGRHHDRGEATQAHRLYRQGLDHQRTALQATPGHPLYRERLALQSLHFAELLLEMAKLEEAKSVCEELVPLAAKLEQDFPRVAAYRQVLVGALERRAELLTTLGRLREARRDWQRALELQQKLAAEERKDAAKAYAGEARQLLRQGVRQIPDDPKVQDMVADLLATAPEEPLRNPAAAVELAEKAVRRSPKTGAFQHTLGLAYYRAGKYKDAITALGESMKLRSGGDAVDCFFLAMAHWRLDDKKQAGEWYARGVRWLEENEARLKQNENYHEELRRFRAEATTLLGVKAGPERKPE
jgi:tetratricopeptide (TPR) repeat protein